MALFVELLRALLLLTHLASNAFACGGPLAATVLPLESETRQRLARFGLWALGIGLLTGGLAVVLVLVGARPGYEEAAARVPLRDYVMLTIEWAFTAVLYVVYVKSWNRLGSRRVLHGLIGVLAATNLLYHFPAVMIVLGRLADNSALAGQEVVNRAVLLEVLATPWILARTLHFWSLSGLAAGAGTMVISDKAESPASTRRTGAAVALIGIAMLFLTGGWQLMGAGGRSGQMLAFDSPAGWCFLAGVLCGLMATTGFAVAVASSGERGARPVQYSVAAATLMTLASVLV